MKRLFLCVLLPLSILASATQLQAQGLDAQSWRRQASQHILAYLHASGTDLVLATRAAGPVPPSGERTVLRITIDRSGRIMTTHVVKQSGYPNLDRLASRLVRQAGPLPPLPASAPNSLSVNLPIAFHSGGSRGEFFHVSR